MKNVFGCDCELTPYLLKQTAAAAMGILVLGAVAFGADPDSLNFASSPGMNLERVDHVRVQALVNDHRVVRGKPFVVRVQLTIDPKFHINSNQPLDKLLIPTRVLLNGAPGLAFETARYPKALTKKLSFSPNPLSLFVGEIEIDVPGVSDPKGPLGRRIITGAVKYQACDDQVCFPPQTLPFEVPVDVVQNFSATAFDCRKSSK